MPSSGQPLGSQGPELPHHGADSSLTLTFLQVVNPQASIVSVGADNRFGHPHQVTLEKLQGMPTYRTDQQGNIEVLSDGERYWVMSDRSEGTSC